MNEPPGGPPDPNAFTQPIPTVAQQPPLPPHPAARQPATGQSGQPSTPYRHVFGNVPLYVAARFVAFVLDLFGVAFVLTAFGFNAFDRGFQAFAGRNEAGFATLALSSLAIAATVAYLCEALTGATIGKLTFALHTRRVDGGHAGGGRVLLRYLLAPIDLVLIGPILALVTRRHQRLGDLLSGTVVSASRLRWFAPVLGIVLIAGIAFAQIAYGGGLTSAIEVLAESSIVLPGYIAKASQAAGFGAVRVPPIPVPALPSNPAASQTPAPQAVTTDAPTDIPSVLETAAPVTESAAPETETAAPAAAPSDVPTAAASDAPPAEPSDDSATPQPA